MRFRYIVFPLLLASAATLAYGALVESNRLVVERRSLKLKSWPKSLDGLKIALLADIHLRNQYSLALAKRAVVATLEEDPDFILIPGDLIDFWKPGIAEELEELLTPFAAVAERVVVSTGNHEFGNGSPEPLAKICKKFGFTLLRNSAVQKDGITFIGIDSANAFEDDPAKAFKAAEELTGPKIVLWHEPDMVDELPETASLMVSGHSHGGQFRFPGGFTPMHTRNGKKYVRGFYPHAKVPLYVSRGIGTTGPPSRLNCAPEISILTLWSPEE